jgi:hypothetical protein
MCAGQGSNTCKIACNIGSDSISMKSYDGLMLFSERKQHQASQSLPAVQSAVTWTFTTAGAHTRALTARHPIKLTSTRCPSAWQPNPGRRSTHQSGKSVQTTGARSYRRTSTAPQVSPAPIATIKTRSPALIRLSRIAAFKANGIDAADVFACASTVLITFWSLRPTFRATALIRDSPDDSQTG